MRPTREDRWLAAWLVLTFLTAFFLMWLNAARFHFTGADYFPRWLWPVVFIPLNALVTGLAIRDGKSRLAPVLVDGGFYGLAMIGLTVLVQGIQYTPMTPIDGALADWDRRLGFDLVATLRWTAERPALRWALNRCYESTDLQLALAPLVPLLLRDRERSRMFLHAMIYATLVGSLIYYFYPSSGPAGAYASPDFLWVQRATFMKFQQVHSGRPVTTVWGGMIALPSFHVAWAALVSYACWTDKRIFVPVAALNAVVIASTLLLGWHHAVDVPAGLLLAAASLATGAAARHSLSRRDMSK